VSGVTRDVEAVQELATALPFTPLELDELARDMLLTASLPERVGAWLSDFEVAPKPLSGFGAIFTIHHQTDFVLLVEQALELGIDPSLVTVIDKEYRYAHSRRVDAHIRQKLGIPVFRYSKITDGLSEHIRRVAAARDRTGARTWTQTIVIDDGGYIYPRLHKEFEAYMTLFKGLVEQTASGIWALEPFVPKLALPVFSVAESRLKQVIEAHGVAAAGVANVRRLLPQEKFDARPAVVVGFGRVGQAAAETLRRANADVWVVDIAAGAQASAGERGFRCSSDLAATVVAARPRYVFACARPGAVDEAALLAIPCDCALISLTSRDVGIDKRALEEHFEREELGTLGTRYRRNGVELLLIANGFPANFHFAESMPNQQSDVVMAALLAGAVALASGAWGTGNDAARADSILSEGTLMTDFIHKRPPLGPLA
jgi:adenosylhomocysteinase